MHKLDEDATLSTLISWITGCGLLTHLGLRVKNTLNSRKFKSNRALVNRLTQTVNNEWRVVVLSGPVPSPRPASSEFH